MIGLNSLIAELILVMFEVELPEVALLTTASRVTFEILPEKEMTTSAMTPVV